MGGCLTGVVGGTGEDDCSVVGLSWLGWLGGRWLLGW